MATSLLSLPPLTGDTSWIDNPTGMEGLPTPIAPARPNAPGTTGTSSTWSDWPPKPSTTLSGGYLAALGQWAAGTLTVHTLEDFIFMGVGLILIAAAAAAFAFKGAETVVDVASRGVSRVSRTAGKARALAEVAT